MPVIELATFQASEALLANPDMALDSLAIIKSQEGFIEAYTGYDIDDKKSAYLTVAWDSLESHKKMQSSASYPDLIEKIKPTLASPLAIAHVEFSNDYTIPFGAPLTQLVTYKLKEGKTKEDLDAFIAEMTAHYSERDIPGVRKPFVYGEVIETPGTFYTATGWDSIETNRALTSAESTSPIIGKLLSIVEPTSAKVEFKKA